MLGFSTSLIAFKKSVTFKAQALRKLPSVPVSHPVKSLKKKIKVGLHSKKKKELRGNSLVAQWLGLHTSTGDLGSIPGWGMAGTTKKKKKKKRELRAIPEDLEYL